jgi:hypothetical protein
MLVDVSARRVTGGDRPRVDEESFAAGLNQLAERFECRIAAPVLVGRDDWLRGAGAHCQFGLSQPPPSSNVLKKLSCIHSFEYIDLSISWLLEEFRTGGLLGPGVRFDTLREHRERNRELVEAARVLNAMTDFQRERLGVKRWDPTETYPRVERLFVEVTAVLETGVAGIDATWFANQLARAAIPKDALVSHSVAVDGTDLETWGRLRGSTIAIELDGPAADTQIIDDAPRPSLAKAGRGKRAKVFATGPDGRKQHTKDPDARAGHRSAKGNSTIGPYVGYELHLAVQTREVRWTNHVDKTTLGPEVPNVITTCNLVPAGSHRGEAIVRQLIGSKPEVQDIADVVWDPGYSLCQPGTTAYPLAQAGIEQTLEIVTHQRGIRPFAGDALHLDGQLYSPFLPAELRDSPMPPRSAPAPLRASYEKAFSRRASYRYVRHSKPDKDGVTLWKCPFHAGLLRSRQLPETMRHSCTAPLVELPAWVTECCQGTLSAPPAELPLTQKIPYGTTASRISMYRRQAVESVNAALQGSFTNIARGFVRVFGVVKITMLLGFTVAAFNVDRVRGCRAKLAELAGQPKRRAKRRQGTYPTASRQTPSRSTTGPRVHRADQPGRAIEEHDIRSSQRVQVAG